MDNYTHIDNDVFYIFENIPTEDTSQQFEEVINIACECGEICEAGECSCLKYSNITYGREGKIRLENVATEVVYECNSSCKCFGKKCGNRLVQLGPNKDLTIIKCENVGKGFGLVSKRPIEKGEFICEYAGEVISEKEAKKRFAWNQSNGHMNYIFCINEHYNNDVTKTYIDPSKFGNIGRYINHSCRPNCFLLPVRVETMVPKLCIFAKQDIKENTELTFDYGDGTLGFDSNNENLEKIKCLCNESVCREYLPFSKEI